MNPGICLRIGDDDFVPLAGHDLEWRLGDPMNNVLPPEDLAQVRVLSPAKAAWVGDVLWKLVDLKPQALAPAAFQTIESAETSGDPEATRLWLRPRIPPKVDGLILSWSWGAAVVTTARVFARYWDDFCYPSSDDVLAWSMHDDWAALYHHSEVLSVGTRRPHAPGSAAPGAW